MPQYLYQVAYTSESLAAQIKTPQDRLEVVGKQISDAVGARILAGGYSYGEYDVSVIVDAPDDVSMAAVALAIAAGGAVRAAKTTPLLSGGQWVAALRKAPAVSAQYRPPARRGGARAARCEPSRGPPSSDFSAWTLTSLDKSEEERGIYHAALRVHMREVQEAIRIDHDHLGVGEG